MNSAQLAAFLARHVTWIARDPASAVCLREIREITTLIQNLTDRPQTPTLRLQCPNQCAGHITLAPHEKTTRCPTCHTTHHLHDIVEQRLTQLPDLLFRADEILTLLDLIRRPLPESTWRRWRATNYVPPAGELYGQPAWRITDVLRARNRRTRRDKTAPM